MPIRWQKSGIDYKIYFQVVEKINIRIARYKYSRYCYWYYGYKWPNVLIAFRQTIISLDSRNSKYFRFLNEWHKQIVHLRSDFY